MKRIAAWLPFTSRFVERSGNLNVVHVYVAMSVVFGIFFILLTPPFKTPDEAVHIERAYEVASMRVPKYHDDVQKVGNYLPASIQKTISKTGADFVIGQKTNNKFNISEFSSIAVSTPLAKSEKIFYETSGSPAYMPILYIPQAFIAFMSMMFNLPVIATVYVIRLTMLIIWITLSAFCLSKIKRRGWMVAAVLLLPTVLAQAASPGLDVVSNLSVLIFITLIINMMKRKVYSRRILTLLTVVGTVMVFSKFTSAVFLLMCLFLLNKKREIKNTIVILLIILVPLLAFGAWSSIISKELSSYTPIGTSSVSQPQMQRNNIINEPLVFVKALFSTILISNGQGDTAVASVVGNFGWLDTPLPELAVVFGYIVIAGSIFIRDESGSYFNSFDWRRLLSVVIVLMFFLSIFLAMYIYFNSDKAVYISGINGRYFVPGLVVLAVFGGYGVRAEKRLYGRYVLVSSFILLTVSQITLFVTYF